MTTTLALLAWLSAGLGLPAQVLAMGVPQIQYMTSDEFVRQVFGSDVPEWKMLFMDAALKKKAADILQHPYTGMRVRYWVTQQRTAWVIDEIGKEMPITIGVSVGPAGIEQVSILVYREERGGEVQQDFFTQQFHGVTLTPQDQLSKSIDGITGATLSVHAVSRAANLALVLHRRVLESAKP